MKLGKTIRPSSVEREMLQTVTGSRPQVMPGARMVTTVVTMFMPPSAIDIATTMIVKQYASIPTAAWSASGA